MEFHKYYMKTDMKYAPVFSITSHVAVVQPLQDACGLFNSSRYKYRDANTFRYINNSM